MRRPIAPRRSWPAYAYGAPSIWRERRRRPWATWRHGTRTAPMRGRPPSELSYLLLHDPDLRCVRREHLHEVGKRVRLKKNIDVLSALLKDLEGHPFSFYVVSAAPEEVIQSALEGIRDAEHIALTKL